MRYRTNLVATCLLASLSVTPARAGQYWARALGGTGSEQVHCARQLSDGSYVVVGSETSFAGGGNRDVWLIKLNTYGSVAWQKSYGGAEDDSGKCVEPMSDGSYIVVGDTTSYGAGKSDMWVFRVDARGNIGWQRAFGGIENDSGCAAEETAAGDVFVLGNTTSFGFDGAAMLVKFDSAGQVLWQRAIGGNAVDEAHSLTATADGGAVIVGQTKPNPDGKLDAWLVKVDAAGEIVWQERCGGKNHDVATSVREAADGSLIVAGYTYSYGAGASDSWLLKASSTGKVLRQRAYGGTDIDDSYGICLAEDGGYLLGGATYSFDARDRDIWILRLDSDFKIVWQKRFGGVNYEVLCSIQPAGDGGCIAAGTTESYGSGIRDAWLLRLDAAGAIDSSCGDLYATTRAAPKGSSAGTKAMSEQSMLMSAAATSHAKASSTAGVNTPQCQSPNCTVSCMPEVPASGKWGTAVTFTGKVEITPACSGASVEYEWDFGDGSPHSTQQNPMHTYSTKGTYTWEMMATASGVGSCSKSGSIKIGDPSLPKPEIHKLTPGVGKGGDTIEIQGLYFAPIQGTSKVQFGPRDVGTAKSWSHTSIKVVAPSGATTCDVTVTVVGKKSNGLEFIVRPVLGNVEPTSGPASGGTRVTIIAPAGTSGTQFNVLFGSALASDTRFTSPDLITCDSPPGTGTVDVKVTSSVTSTTVGTFTYR